MIDWHLNPKLSKNGLNWPKIVRYGPKQSKNKVLAGGHCNFISAGVWRGIEGFIIETSKEKIE